MGLRSGLAIGVAGVARWGLRSVLHRNGGVLPGSLALKVDPQLLASLAARVDESIVVTGTNGKTTTTNLLANAIAAAGADVVCNRAGNNMETGITGALIEAGPRSGTAGAPSTGAADAPRSGTAGAPRTGEAGVSHRVGVFECDELYTVRVLPKLRPRYLVLLNLFRDQLDRYGEIDHTQEVIARALASSPETALIFNADDPLCASIADRVGNRSIPFGIDGAVGTESDPISDSRFCAKCNAPLTYDYVQYGQLGKYSCPRCGWARPRLARRVLDVRLGEDGYAFNVEDTHLTTTYNGLYMVYNIAAAFFAAREMGMPAERFQGVLDAYRPVGGRTGKFELNGRRILTNLAKNPVGFDRIIQQVCTSGGRTCAFFLNDNDADGHDVSWIWDVEFERLAGTPGLTCFAGGTRAHDMQIRLKYAGIDARLIKGIGEAVNGANAAEAAGALPAGEILYAVANYTALPMVLADIRRDGGAEAAFEVPARAGFAKASPAEPPLTQLTTAARPIRLVHLYPDALNLYGDRGNICVLRERCLWRGIPVRVDEVRMGDELDLDGADVVMMGGGADRDQLAVVAELRRQREVLASYVADGGALLAICGSYQLLGSYYEMGGERVEGLGILDIKTIQGEGRLIGNVAVQTELFDQPLVGFENHGGRTYLGADERPLGRSLVAGTGNNEHDGHEGVLHGGVVGTYFHGPVLPKNVALADWLLAHAIKRANLPYELTPLDDERENAAHAAAMKLIHR